MSFTPPADKTPFERPANECTAKQVGTAGTYGVYLISDANGNNPAPHFFTAPKKDTQTQLDTLASWNAGWQKFLAATVSPQPPSPQDAVAAQNWFNTNCGPSY